MNLMLNGRPMREILQEKQDIRYDEISLDRQTVVRVLTAITVFLLLASTAGQVARHVFGHSHAFGLVRLFYIDSEGNIPTFFSASLLLCASLLLALISLLKKQSNDSRWFQWTILSFALLYMAVDEASGIHELLQKPGIWLLGGDRYAVFKYAWVVFGIVFVLIFVLSYLKFFFSLPLETRRQFFVAATVFLSGGLGMELVESYYVGTYGGDNFQHVMIVTVEECLEMAGVIVFINALLHYIIRHHDVRLHLSHVREIL